MEKYKDLSIERSWKQLAESYVYGVDRLLKMHDISEMLCRRDLLLHDDGSVNRLNLVKSLRLIRKILGPEVIMNLWCGIRLVYDYSVLFDLAERKVAEELRDKRKVEDYLDRWMVCRYPQTEKVILALSHVASSNQDIFNSLYKWMISEKIIGRIDSEYARYCHYNKLKFATSSDGMCVMGDSAVIESGENQYIMDYDKYVIRPLIMWNEWVGVNPYNQIIFGFLNSLGLGHLIGRINLMLKSAKFEPILIKMKRNSVWEYFYENLMKRPYGDNYSKVVKYRKTRSEFCMMVSANQTVIDTEQMIGTSTQVYDKTECCVVNCSMVINTGNILYDVVMLTSWFNHLQKLLTEVLEAKVGDKTVVVLKPYCPVLIADSDCKYKARFKKGKTIYQLYRNYNNYEIQTRNLKSGDCGESGDLSYIGMFKSDRWIPPEMSTRDFICEIEKLTEMLWLEKNPVASILDSGEASKSKFIKYTWVRVLASLWYLMNGDIANAELMCNYITEMDYRIAIKDWLGSI